MPNLTIEADSVEHIQKSFERIAKDLIHNWHLKVGNELFSFTEIEFYYFHEDLHKDNTTHEHTEPEGTWRFHNQGLDITFAPSDKSDGGILLRGLKSGGSYVNGPRRVVNTIFKSFGSVRETNNQFGLIRKEHPSTEDIYKTVRHGLSSMQDNAYKDEHYRYYTDIVHWKQLTDKDKEKIREMSTMVNYD